MRRLTAPTATRANPKARALRWTALVVVLMVALTVLVGVLFRPRSQPSVATQQLTLTGARAPWDSQPVTLDATLYLPEVRPAPAVLLAHGFGGTKTSVAADAERLARAGFVVLTYSARGFGQSTGEISLNSLDAEIPDARAVVDYLATRPEVLLDSAGDPRIGVTGASYGGALALMLAGTDRRIDAVVPVITWHDLANALFPNGVEKAGVGSGVFKRSWASAMIASVVTGTSLAPSAVVDLGPASGRSGARDRSGSTERDAVAPQGPPAPPAFDLATLGCGRLRTDLCRAYTEAARDGTFSRAMQQLLKKSSPAAVVNHVKAPTLLVQGELDTLFGLDEAAANARALAAVGTTVAVDWYRGGHDGGAPDTATTDRITGWLRYHLTGSGADPGQHFRYSVDGGLTDSGRPRTRTLQTATYPAAQLTRLTVHGPEQIVLNPAGGTPASISTLPGLGAGIGSGLLSGQLALPGQTATFIAPAQGRTSVIVGSASATVTVSRLPTAAAPAASPSDAVLFAAIGVRTSGGLIRMGGNAVIPIRIPTLPADGTPVTIPIRLPMVALQVGATDQLLLRITSTDQAYATPVNLAAYRVGIAGPVTLPLAEGVRVSAGEVPLAAVMTIGVLALVALVGLVLAGRVRRPRQATATADAPPLRVIEVAKSYPGGVHAVTGVSFVVPAGRVVGLLGPNGAGKTTTLRMVMGLIRPTGGRIEVFGVPVHPGADILARIGSFVEGAGFLPHLSGRTNLELYWQATGRPAETSHLDQVLRIAGLGRADARRVGTYSQGMQQRLAIAQAMLGLPDLLVLDEPTNGLDPPQIHAMREVLRGYAATGRTVLVSSHLLSEVEQTCTDVVVIHQGRTVAQGLVSELVAQSGLLVITVDDVPGAAQTVRAAGFTEVSTAENVLEVDAGARSAEVIDLLVRAGYRVSSAAPRNRLEDVFLDLVGARQG